MTKWTTKFFIRSVTAIPGNYFLTNTTLRLVCNRLYNQWKNRLPEENNPCQGFHRDSELELVPSRTSHLLSSYKFLNLYLDA